MLQPVQLHALFIHLHADDVCAVDAHGVDAADEGRQLYDDRVAGVAEDVRRQGKTLLSAGGDDEIVKVAANAEFLLQPLLRRRTQGRIPFGHAVLQTGQGLLLKNTRRDFADFLHGNGLVGGASGRKCDDFGMRCGVFQNFADRRRANIGNTIRKMILHTFVTTFLYVMLASGFYSFEYI